MKKKFVKTNLKCWSVCQVKNMRVKRWKTLGDLRFRYYPPACRTEDIGFAMLVFRIMVDAKQNSLKMSISLRLCPLFDRSLLAIFICFLLLLHESEEPAFWHTLIHTGRWHYTPKTTNAILFSFALKHSSHSPIILPIAENVFGILVET